MGAATGVVDDGALELVVVGSLVLLVDWTCEVVWTSDVDLELVIGGLLVAIVLIVEVEGAPVYVLHIPLLQLSGC